MPDQFDPEAMRKALDARPASVSDTADAVEAGLVKLADLDEPSRLAVVQELRRRSGPDSTPHPPAASSQEATPNPATEQPTPTEEEAQAAGLGTPRREQLLAAWDSGYAGQAFDGVTPPVTAYEKEVALAWAKGVWQRQGEAEERRRRQVLAELEAKHKLKVPEQTPEARLVRAVEYQRRFG